MDHDTRLGCTCGQSEDAERCETYSSIVSQMSDEASLCGVDSDGIDLRADVCCEACRAGNL
jgi:hypothetical protein